MKKTLLLACVLAGASHGTPRPTALAQAADGSLFITDDTGGTIWKVTYRGTSR